MNPIAISVKKLSKKYHIYKRPLHLLLEFLIPRLKLHTEKEVLKDISFDLYKGEVIGVIGRNGAGKSTLLKILSGKLDASGGEILVNGKISAILELGTGFNPELSGRENVILGAMCIGMTKEQALEKLDSIIEFSGLQSVIDSPFKTYSSGMQARLTFATAISVDPDILIVDEALAAGDAFFVNKSLKRIDEICRSGATVLFVSHSLNLIERFCHRVMLIEDGLISDIGDTKKIAKKYEMAIIKEQTYANAEVLRNRNESEIGTGEAKILDLKIYNNKNEVADVLEVGKPAVFEITYRCDYDNLDMVVALLVYSAAGTASFSVHNESYLNELGLESHFKMKSKKGVSKMRINCKHLFLARGQYHASVALQPHARIQSYDELYDFKHMQWSFSVIREGTYQWVHYEQPVTFQLDS